MKRFEQLWDALTNSAGQEADALHRLMKEGGVRFKNATPPERDSVIDELVKLTGFDREDANSLLQELADKKVVVRCPRCAIDFHLSYPATETCEIKWDEKAQAFAVSLKMGHCRRCHGVIDERILRLIPVEIAEKSSCSCGSTLVLNSHTLCRQGDYLEFKGKYVCESCHKSKNPLVHKIGERLLSLWKKTRKIEVGPSGVSYEKDT